MIMTFGTLSASKVLRGAGVPEASAEAVVSVVGHDWRSEHLVTREDLKGDLEKLEARPKLFVASSVLGGAGVIVLAQIILKALGVAT